MKSNNLPIIIYCNNANILKYKKYDECSSIRLEYRECSKQEQNIRIKLPEFLYTVNYLPNRLLDLMEIAGYVFAADRLLKRGETNALEFHAWERETLFVVKVRDYNFWNSKLAKNALSCALNFMTGDKNYRFYFQPGHDTPPTSLLDSEEFIEKSKPNSVIALFSGGLDSYAGVLDLLENSQKFIYLVSHQSGQPSTKRTQNRLFKALEKKYPNRLHHVRFECGLSKIKPVEETQRTRSFLYTSIAYVLAHTFSLNCFYVFENGITALNFPKRQDLIEARASRTTHPKTLHFLENLFTCIEEKPIQIKTPLFYKTKTDIFLMIKESNGLELISSTVSCSKTFQNIEIATHCGGCSQCVDRRFAAYGSNTDEIDDSGIYGVDFIIEGVTDSSQKTILIDFIRQAQNFSNWNIDHFYLQMINELTEFVDYIPGSDNDIIENVFNLAKRHGNQIKQAIQRMRQIHDNPFQSLPKNSVLNLINKREYLKEPTERLAEKVCEQLSKYIPKAFRRFPPKNENDLNDKINAFLNEQNNEIEQEFPSVRFALSNYVPDHSISNYSLLFETKYLRGNTTPSKASEGIAADLTKSPRDCFITFIIYDPNRAIVDDTKFSAEFEKAKPGYCKVFVIR